MIIPMKHLLLAGPAGKNEAILKQLREFGAVHLVPISEIKTSATLLDQMAQIARSIEILSKRKQIADQKERPVIEITTSTLKLAEELTRLRTDLTNWQNEQQELEPWGDFNLMALKSLHATGCMVQLWISHPKSITEFQADIVQIIKVTATQAYVITVKREKEIKIPHAASEFPLPEKSLREVQTLIGAANQQISAKEKELDFLASYFPLLQKTLVRLQDEEKVKEVNSGFLNNDYFFVTEGWFPAEQEEALRKTFPELTLITRDPIKGVDTPPVKFRNNWFVQPFEELVRSFTGISYFSALDTTWTVAVLFPIFAAFCLNDAGYGLIIAIAGFLLKKKSETKNFGQIAIISGVATIILGALDAQYFGWTAYNPILPLGKQEVSMAASLGIGAATIIFALIIAVVKNGWRSNALGTLFFIMGLGITFYVPLIDLTVYAPLIGKVVIGIGVVFWVLYPDSIFGIKIADGIWQVYGTIMGLFGDSLSFLRLFALAISGSLLAVIVNEMGKGIPLGVNIIYYVSCHSLLLVLSLISVYIHANRLIFLEFGSRCIDGGTLFYQPFAIGDRRNDE